MQKIKQVIFILLSLSLLLTACESNSAKNSADELSSWSSIIYFTPVDLDVAGVTLDDVYQTGVSFYNRSDDKYFIIMSGKVQKSFELRTSKTKMYSCEKDRGWGCLPYTDIRQLGNTIYLEFFIKGAPSFDDDIPDDMSFIYEGERTEPVEEDIILIYPWIPVFMAH